MFNWCAGGFRGFVDRLSRKCGKSGVDSLVWDFHYIQAGWLGGCGGRKVQISLDF
jgi:hypothetical protein